MQRRAAAIYFVFFLVVGAAAWAYIGVAEDAHQPQFDLSGTTFEADTTQTIGDVEYTVSEVGHAGGDGHGGGDGDLEATLSWTDPSANQSATLEHNSTVTYEGDEYTLLVANESDPSEFTLEQEFNVSGMLAADDSVEDELAEHNGSLHVVTSENNTLIPLAEWLPEPNTEEFAEGDSFPYENETTTVASVASGGVTLEWQGPTEQETDLTEGANVTLANGNTYFAHFPSEEQVQLVPQDQYDSYAQTVAEREYFSERKAGLWGVTIISGFAALLVLPMAYMPNRG